MKYYETPTNLFTSHISGGSENLLLADQTIVIKIGGAALRCAGAAKALCADFAKIVSQGAKVVLVHGGGPAITAKLAAQGQECRYVQGLRVTDHAVLSAATEVLAEINEMLANELMANGIEAKAMFAKSSIASGSEMSDFIEGSANNTCEDLSSLTNSEIMTARRKYIVEPSGAKFDIGLVGEVSNVDELALKQLMETCVPVFASLVPDLEGQLHNVNADNVAMALAVALCADKLVYLTDVPGILLHDGVVLHELPVSDIGLFIDSGIIQGGMIPKVRSCALGMRQGVQSVIITNSEDDGDLYSAVVHPGEKGTLLCTDGYPLGQTA